MDSMLCRFKVTYLAERIDNVRHFPKIRNDRYTKLCRYSNSNSHQRKDCRTKPFIFFDQQIVGREDIGAERADDFVDL